MLAGGQSLIPLMKLRLAAPTALIDINRVGDLGDAIARGGGGLVIGARVRHKDCERSEHLRGRYAALGRAAPQISDPIVRNHGTVCGSLAHADPQGDWGSVMLAVGAEVVVRGPAGVAHDLDRRPPRRPVHDDARAERDHHRGARPRPGTARLRDVPEARAQDRRLRHRRRRRPGIASQRRASAGPGSRSPASGPTQHARPGRRGGARRARSRRGRDPGCGAAGGGGRPAARRCARHGGVQAERRPGLHRARPAPGRRRGSAGREGDAMATTVGARRTRPE